MKLSLAGVLLLVLSVAAEETLNDAELASRILQRASRSVEGTSFLGSLDDYLFLFQQGGNFVGSEVLNNVLFSMDRVTPSFNYVMDSVYGRGYRLNEKYKRYVQMYMTEDQVADHNHLLKVYKEQFNEDYDRYLASGISTEAVFGTPQPISENAMEYLDKTISGNFPPGKKYTQQELANGVASVLKGFQNVQTPPPVIYVPNEAPRLSPGQARTAGSVPQKLPPAGGWEKHPDGNWFYISIVKSEDDLPDGSAPSGPPSKTSDLSYGAYIFVSDPTEVTPKDPAYPLAFVEPRHATSKAQTFSQDSENVKGDTKVSNEYPYKDYALFPQLRSGSNYGTPLPSSPRGESQSNKELKHQSSQKGQSSYTFYDKSADPSMTPMYPPPVSYSGFIKNRNGKNGVLNTEGIPEDFLDGNLSPASPQSYSLPKSRKKRLAELYQSDLPPKILFCPPENLKLVLCAGDMALDALLVRPMLYVLSWFV